MKLLKIAESLAGGCGKVAASVATLGKCLLLSRPVGRLKKQEKRDTLIIMGNGPSLRSTISEEGEALRQASLMAVNFAPNSPEFFSLRPRYLVLADPHFFEGVGKDTNVDRLWKNLKKVDWEMTLFVPVSRRRQVREMLEKAGEHVSIEGMNLTPAEGIGALRRFLYRKGLAMPRPRNVLIPALMMALRLGYPDVRLVGADHSWSKTLWVDDQNRVISVQPHFYEDNEKERERVASEYAGYHIHHIYRSLAVAFASYFDIEEYARKEGAAITNCTPGSFIDAFPRSSLTAVARGSR